MRRIVKYFAISLLPLTGAVLLWWYVSFTEQADGVLQVRIDVTTAILGLGCLLSLLLAVCLLLVHRGQVKRERMLAQLGKQNKLEQQRFIQRLNHELKNPLTALSLSAENLRLQNDNTAFAKDIDNIQVQSQRLSALTGDLGKLHLSENQSVDLEQVDIAQLLEEIVEMASESESAKVSGQSRDFKLLVPAAPWPVPRVTADRDLLQLALYNLVDNAVKYSESGDTIELHATEDGDFVKIVVADTGIGIADADRDQIFDELFRGTNAREQTGSGIGLSLVKRIVDRHGGKIVVDSKEHQGTRVSIQLPAA